MTGSDWRTGSGYCTFSFGPPKEKDTQKKGSRNRSPLHARWMMPDRRAGKARALDCFSFGILSVGIQAKRKVQNKVKKSFCSSGCAVRLFKNKVGRPAGRDGAASVHSASHCSGLSFCFSRRSWKCSTVRPPLAPSLKTSPSGWRAFTSSPAFTTACARLQ